MCIGAVGDLVAHAREKPKGATIREFGLELARNAQQNVALFAPVIGEVVSRVLDHAHADCTELACTPARDPAFTCVLRCCDVCPVRDTERNIG